MSIHTGKKSFKCEQCGREFARKDILTGHMKTHTGEKSFECKQCGKRLASKNALDYHTKTHTRSHNGINLWI
ncbi:C2H2-type zinc finger protein [Cardinium endosymbiont of Philonthus spinipes]|uniref:C2H2-type zinc finger protein n=1 Tax=Cardinium endosymbiont of Philonthus spinipes TaxID=3077941 RepID=UPI003CC7A4D0